MQDDKPTPSAVRDAAGISQSYASMILSDEEGKRRVPPRSLAILIFRKTGWRHSTIADLTEEQMAVFEQVDPWSPRQPREEAA